MIKYLYFEYTILGLSQESVVCSVHAFGNNLCDYSSGLWSEWGWHLLFLSRDIVKLAGASVLTFITILLSFDI